MKKILFSGLLLGALTLPARAQYTDSMGYRYNNPVSAQIGTHLNNQMMSNAMRSQVFNQAMANRGTARAYNAAQARGKRLVAQNRGTTRFAPRPFPIDKYMAGVWSGQGDFKLRQRNYQEWLGQKAIWTREIKARGAQPNDMAQLQALAFLIGVEAYSGQRVSNAGFAAKSASIRRVYLKDVNYQSYSALQKQEFLETTLVSATYALWLRENGDADKARATAGQFLDSRWTTDHKGVSDIDDAVASLSRYFTKTATRTATASPASQM